MQTSAASPRIVVCRAWLVGLFIAFGGCGSVSPLRPGGGSAGGAGRDTGGGADGRTDGGSPGAVTLRFVTPAGRSFCDRCGGVYISILDGAGQPTELDVPSCSATCSTCAPTLCHSIVCAPRARPATEELTWDGRAATPASCGNGVSCYEAAFLPAGRYTARMCATPGTLMPTEGGAPTTCTATGPTECVDVPFDLPGPGLVVGTLP